MHPINTRTNRATVAIVIIALALSFTTIATLGTARDGTDGGFFASLGDYLTQVGEALGGG